MNSFKNLNLAIIDYEESNFNPDVYDSILEQAKYKLLKEVKYFQYPGVNNQKCQ